VVITGTTSTGALVANLWHNQSDGTFTDSGMNLPAVDLGFAAWGDYDNDGNLDLLYGGNSNEGWITRIYHNTGGALSNLNAELLGLIWSSAAWGDFDNDGDLDFMIIGYDPVAQVKRSILYRNDAGVFVDSGATFHNVFLGTVSWADYDNDGNLDLLLAGNETGIDILSIYRNNSGTPNTPPTPPTNLLANVIGTSVEFSWGPGGDVQTPAHGLSYNLRLGTTPGGSEIVTPQSSSAGYRRLPEMGNRQSGLAARITNLKPGTNYYWSAQSVDTAFAGSPFAAERSFTALADLPVIVSFVREGVENVRGTWRGTPATSYQVFASSNLSSWTLLATPTANASGLFDILESTSTAPLRFYRAVRP
jgi:hypothetical protein